METEAEYKVSSQQNELDRVLEKINEISKKSNTGDYIYRGETAHHKEPPYCGRVTSGLYRHYLEMGVEHVNVEAAQQQILMEAQGYIHDGRSDSELLATLQHYGDKTNLIDFTTDYLIALFFACEGEPRKPGRVILLLKEPEDETYVYNCITPARTIRRADIQKSIFVQAAQGVVPTEVFKVVCIPANLKLALLDYLRKHHDISTKTIYNDLHGFIEKRRLHRRAYKEFHEGFTSQRRVDSAKTEAEKQECYNDAITHYTAAIDLKPDLVEAYNNRGIAYRNTGNLDAAIEDFNRAIDLDSEYAGVYNNRGDAYADKDDFDAAIEDVNRAIDLELKEASVKGEYMKNKRFNRNIFGDLPTQKMAQEALPILVSHAQKGEIITLGQLAKEIAPHLTQFNWSMGWALAWIHTTLYELERSDEWNYGEIPAIAAIAVVGARQPTNWMDKRTRINPNTPLPWEDYKTNHILPVFEYPHWDKVMKFVLGNRKIY